MFFCPFPCSAWSLFWPLFFPPSQFSVVSFFFVNSPRPSYVPLFFSCLRLARRLSNLFPCGFSLFPLSSVCFSDFICSSCLFLFWNNRRLVSCHSWPTEPLWCCTPLFFFVLLYLSAFFRSFQNPLFRCFSPPFPASRCDFFPLLYQEAPADFVFRFSTLRPVIFLSSSTDFSLRSHRWRRSSVYTLSPPLPNMIASPWSGVPPFFVLPSFAPVPLLAFFLVPFWLIQSSPAFAFSRNNPTLCSHGKRYP